MRSCASETVAKATVSRIALTATDDQMSRDVADAGFWLRPGGSCDSHSAYEYKYE